MKAVVAAFNQEKALVGAFSVITNLRMELFEALLARHGGTTRQLIQFNGIIRCRDNKPNIIVDKCAINGQLMLRYLVIKSEGGGRVGVGVPPGPGHRVLARPEPRHRAAQVHRLQPIRVSVEVT